MFVVSRQLQSWLRGESVKLHHTEMFADRICIQEIICLKSEAGQSKLFSSNKMTGLYVQRGLW